MIVKMMLVWSLWAGGPGDHGAFDRPIAVAARLAVRQSRQVGERPQYVACAILCTNPAAEDDADHEDTLTCRAAPDLVTATRRLLGAIPDAEVWPNPEDYR